MMKRKKKFIAFREITFTKLLMIIVTLVTLPFLYKQFMSSEMIPEFEWIIKFFLGSWAAYAGKSGYEYYTGYRYGNYRSMYDDTEAG
jgi:hypothetical protein